MNMAFGVAIVISTVIHSVILAPLFNAAVLKTGHLPDSVVTVEYITIAGAEMNAAAKRGRPADTPKAAAELLKNREAVRQEVRELAKTQAQVRSTKDYINYYQLIREKIRERLKGHYRNYHGQGDVILLFMLNSDGSVAAVDAETALSVKDANLIRVAIASVKEASPFPPFPRELAYPKVAFDLTISFKKQ